MGQGLRVLVPVCAIALGAVLVALQGGCGRSSAPPGPASVRGRVSFQGEPVAGGLVVFSPDADRGTSGKPIRGETGPDGTFELRAEGSGSIPPGWYRVAIAPPPGGMAAGGPDFPTQLRRPDRSGLSREVRASEAHFFEFAIQAGTGN